MADTICRPEDLGRVMEDDLDTRIVGETRRMLKRGLTFVQERMAAEAPRDKGDFAASIRPYIDEPLPTWQRGSGGGTVGAGAVNAIMDAWTLGREVGVATDAPYSRKLIFHAGVDRGLISRKRRGRRGRSKLTVKTYRTSERRTYTKKVHANWVYRILDAANHLMEREE